MTRTHRHGAARAITNNRNNPITPIRMATLRRAAGHTAARHPVYYLTANARPRVASDFSLETIRSAGGAGIAYTSAAVFIWLDPRLRKRGFEDARTAGVYCMRFRILCHAGQGVKKRVTYVPLAGTDAPRPLNSQPFARPRPDAWSDHGA